MATKPRVQELDDEEADVQGQDDEGQGDQGSEREEGAPEDAAVDPGEEQEAGDSGDVDEELDDELPPSRGETRQQRLANENRELRERLTNLERRSTQPGPVQTGPQEESEEQFRARIALLPPDERMLETASRSERRYQMLFAQQAFSQQEATDKALFDAKAATDPRYKRWAGEVETRRQQLRQETGQTVPREAMLKFLIGERVLANQGSKEVRRQQARGKQRVERQQTRPSGGRSDVAGTRRGGGSEAEQRRRRLEGLEI